MLNKKIFYYSVLESSQGNLQGYVMKNGEFHLKNSKWLCSDFDNATQSQTNTILCPPRSHKTFVWNIFL